jgi:adenosylhomocysteine nucleosidase
LSKKDMMQTLVVTPLQKELEPLVEGCLRLGFHSENGVVGRLPVVQFPQLGLNIARGGVGKAQFALQTQHLIDTGSGWSRVICAGAAGALSDELAVGDVVVARETIEHDYNNKFSQRPKPRFAGDAGSLAALQEITPKLDPFKVHFGLVASGDEDVVDGERRDVLRVSMEALAVAWEGAGGARACAFSQVPFVEIRGITDTADHNAASSFETNLALAMGNIAQLLVAWHIPAESSS